MKRSFDSYALVTPVHRRQRICNQKKQYGYCQCACTASFEQACQCCKERINVGDCINNPGYGWIHSVCGQDEKRGLPAIEEGFTPDVNLDRLLESEPPRARRRLKWGDEEEEEEVDGEDDKNEDNNDDDDYDEEDSKPHAEAEEEAHHDYLTDEQRRVKNYQPKLGDVICVNALAGCGKTTTIAMVCNNMEKDASLLYLVFNKKNQEEASKSGKFPKNAEIRTTHAFVLRHYFGKENQFKVKPVDDHNLDEIIESADLTAWVGTKFPTLAENKLKRRIKSIAGFIRRTVKNFEASAAENIMKEHIPWRAQKCGMTERTAWKNLVGVNLYLSWSRTYFNDMHEKCKQIRHGTATKIIEIPHDTYLKVAQLRRLQCHHDFVLIDEAQDMTPCQADLFWGDHVRRNRVTYLFGDRHQQLYRFRGASNSFRDMLQSGDATRFSLTGSFRFGKNIANIATSVLKAVEGEILEGRSSEPGKVYSEDDGLSRPGVVLCRSNNGVMKYLFAYPAKKWCYLDGRKKAMQSTPKWAKELENSVYIVCDSSDDDELGYGQNYPQLALDRFKYKGEEFKSIDDLREFADDEEDQELKRYLELLRFLKLHEMTLEAFKATIEKSFQPCKGPIEDYGGIVFATVHKAKGLEFKNVFVFDDFDFKVMGSDLASSRREDELNALYVAVTRAKNTLFLGESVSKFLKKELGSIVPVTASVSIAELRLQWEEDWNQFKDDKTKISSIDDIPWPSSLDGDCPLLLDSRMAEDEQRDFLRTMMLRFHPDKFLPKYYRRFKRGVKGLLESIKERLEDLQRDIVDAKNELEPRGDN